MRLLLFSLIVANLLFFAWAQWVDVPQTGSVATAALPALQIAPAHAQPAASIAAPSQPTAACYSIGPYADADSATRVTLALQGRGFAPRQRNAARNEITGWWDYIAPLKNAAETNRARTALEAAGIKDVEVMSEPEYAGRISVGLFNDEDHAQKRAVTVRALGYTVEVEPRQRQWNDYWLDVDPPAAAPTLALDDPALANGSTLQKAACAPAETAQPATG